MFTRWFRWMFSSQRSEAMEERPERASTAAPQVDPDSALALMISMSSDDAANYIAAVKAEIRECIEDCRLGDPALPLAHIHEQMHRLKNAIAPLGSQELLHACEQLRLDAIGAIGRPNLAARYKAIALAALHAVRRFASSNVGCSS